MKMEVFVDNSRRRTRTITARVLAFFMSLLMVFGLGIGITFRTSAAESGKAEGMVANNGKYLIVARRGNLLSGYKYYAMKRNNNKVAAVPVTIANGRVRIPDGEVADCTWTLRAYNTTSFTSYFTLQNGDRYLSMYHTSPPFGFSPYHEFATRFAFDPPTESAKQIKHIWDRNDYYLNFSDTAENFSVTRAMFTQSSKGADIIFFEAPPVPTYSVTFKDEDGTVLKDAVKYEYGTKAADIVKPEDPVKAADAQYTYTFAGWSPKIEDVTTDAVYTATYNKTKNRYKVSFVDDNGTVLKETMYDYGTAADEIEVPADPVKKGDAQYSYTFAQWEPEIEAVTGDAVYQAAYAQTTNRYTVTWLGENGKVLETDRDVPYGSTPVFDQPIPDKVQTKEYTYTFSGWDPEVKEVTGDAVYRVTYGAERRNYTVFYRYDNDEIPAGAQDQLPPAKGYYYGDPVEKAPVPSLEGYDFSGWENEPGNMPAEDVTVTGRWVPGTGTVYHVEHYLQNPNGIGYDTAITEELKGTTDSTVTAKVKTMDGFTHDPTAPGTVMTGTVKGDGTLVLSLYYTRNQYNITFIDDNGEILKEAEPYFYGTPAADIERPEDPSKEATAQYTYTFTGWTPAIADVTDHAVYQAVYAAATNQYSVTWKSQDGTETYETDPAVDYGIQPSYEGMAPEKAADAEYTYTFAGWAEAPDAEQGTAAEDLPVVSGHKTYYAAFSKTRNQYNVTFVDEDGETILKEAAKYDYGTPAADIVKPDDPAKAATAQYTYTFAGWDPAVKEVTGDATYKAVYTAATNQYKITFVDDDGTPLMEAAEYAYGTKAADIVKPADPSKEADAQYTFAFEGWEPAVADVTEDAEYTAVYSWTTNQYKITFDPNGGTFSDGTSGPAEEICPYGETVQVKEAPVREGYRFLYWKGSEYQPGDLIEVKEDHKLVAQWEEVKPEEPKSPKTSDTSNAALWIIILALAAAVGTGTIVIKRKRNSNS